MIFYIVKPCLRKKKHGTKKYLLLVLIRPRRSTSIRFKCTALLAHLPDVVFPQATSVSAECISFAVPPSWTLSRTLWNTRAVGGMILFAESGVDTPLSLHIEWLVARHVF